ncbi:MAG: DUF1549 domain-containing protein, partial [Saprospiraceae bacterium]|nr:DUF1549 domain-containing protein [Saprospiraceae bacterium]
MEFIRQIFYIVLFGLLLVACRGRQDRVEYSVDVKPILNKKCLNCHGGVRQNGGFSLLTRDLALTPTESGKPAIISRDSKASEMIRRLRSEDAEYRMPFESDPLLEEEIQILEKWIDQGAEWDLHWSYQPIERIDPPTMALGSMASPPPNHPVDLFILEKLRTVGINDLALPADKSTLLRRISLDLIGMPAPDHLKERYLSNKSTNAEKDLIDGLIALPQYGEKWTSMWLDIARYADSKGYERDPHRNIWRYRDWVIRAFNQDMPYDQFIIEQLAGDMLPNPTDDQLLATGFHRNTSTNDEGGTDNEEYRTYAVFDRINTTWEGLMGTTMACVQCHSHPYDPLMHEDYYKSMAFFNNSRDGDTSPDYPVLRHFSKKDRSKLNLLLDWMGNYLEDEAVEEVEQFVKTWQPAWHSIETDSFINSALYDMKYLGLRQNGSCRLPQVDLTAKKSLFIRYRTNRNDGVWRIKMGHLNGAELTREILPSTYGKWKIHQFDLLTNSGIHDLFLTYHSPGVSLNDDRPQVTFDWLRFDEIAWPWEQRDGSQYQKDFWDLLEANTAATPIMLQNPHDMQRKTYRFDRGNFMVKEEEVQPGVPAVLGQWPDRLSQD